MYETPHDERRFALGRRVRYEEEFMSRNSLIAAFAVILLAIPSAASGPWASVQRRSSATRQAIRRSRQDHLQLNHGKSDVHHAGI